MKAKLQTLIVEQKALTARFEELAKELQSTTEESSTLDPKKVYIKGHPTRGAEVIKMLEDWGGVNSLFLSGTNCHVIYRIDDRNIMTNDVCVDNVNILVGYTELHLPEEVSKVDSPKEHIELIKGEVYENEDGCVWIHAHLDVSDSTSISVCGLDNKGNLHLQGWFSLGGLKKAAKTELLFDIIKDNYKHFDKENIRLLDVEEWSKEHRDYPVICRNDNDSHWSVKLMCQYVKGKALVKTKSTINQWFSQAIPYNDQTKCLIGTTDLPDKRYKFVEK